LANGDTAASLTMPPTVTTVATAASGVGTYPLLLEGALDPDYAISYVTGTLTVDAVEVVSSPPTSADGPALETPLEAAASGEVPPKSPGAEPAATRQSAVVGVALPLGFGPVTGTLPSATVSPATDPTRARGPDSTRPPDGSEDQTPDPGSSNRGKDTIETPASTDLNPGDGSTRDADTDNPDSATSVVVVAVSDAAATYGQKAVRLTTALTFADGTPVDEGVVTFAVASDGKPIGQPVSQRVSGALVVATVPLGDMPAGTRSTQHFSLRPALRLRRFGPCAKARSPSRRPPRRSRSLRAICPVREDDSR
jgi:hypothetical protein